MSNIDTYRLAYHRAARATGAGINRDPYPSYEGPGFITRPSGRESEWLARHPEAFASRPSGRTPEIWRSPESANSRRYARREFLRHWRSRRRGPLAEARLEWRAAREGNPRILWI